MYFRDDVCGSFSCYSSPNLCSSPIKPEDHCCYDVCGAAVHVDTEGYRTIKLSMLEGAAKQILAPAKVPISSRKVPNEKDSVSYDNVQYHISRITTSRSIKGSTWDTWVGLILIFYVPPPFSITQTILPHFQNQAVNQPNSKSTQPMYPSTCPSL